MLLQMATVQISNKDIEILFSHITFWRRFLACFLQVFIPVFVALDFGDRSNGVSFFQVYHPDSLGSPTHYPHISYGHSYGNSRLVYDHQVICVRNLLYRN